jgi:hypothetical protein
MRESCGGAALRLSWLSVVHTKLLRDLPQGTSIIINYLYQVNLDQQHGISLRLTNATDL